LSYGENVAPLDFTGFRVACLSGNNGHGKSALLDAITWAVWGKARAEAIDDLVRLGQSSMHVEFDFRFDDHDYRVIRKRTRGRTGQSDLQFQVRNGDGSFQPLTEQGVRATQDRINQTLRIDYDTFINSSFLIQGRADEFARRGPTERKRILGEILGLSAYDRLADAAKREARGADGRRTSLDGELSRIDAELAREPEYRAAREAAAAVAERAGQDLALAQAEQERWRARKGELGAKRSRWEDLGARLTRARDEIAELAKQRDAACARSAAARAVLERREEIETGVAALQAARIALEELSGRAEQLAALNHERGEVRMRLESVRSALDTELRSAQQELKDLLARETELAALNAEVARLEEQVTALALAEAAREDELGRLGELRERRAGLAQQIAQGEQTEREEGEKFALLKGAVARCPVCEEALSEEKRRELGWKLKREREEREARLRAAREDEATLAGQIRDLERGLRERERWLQGARGARDRLAKASEKRDRCQEALAALPVLQRTVAEREATLREQTFAPEEREKLADLDARIAALAYDETARRDLQAKIRALAPLEQEMATLQSAAATVATAEEHATRLAAMIAEREQAIAADAETHALLERELAALPEVEQALGVAEAARDQAASAHTTAQTQLGVCDENLERCARLAVEAGEKRKERSAAEKDRASYEELTRIFGRNGIQALIIENALPEIENAANELLARLTDSQMRVALRTQRDLKNQGVAETLDIEISDELGTRRLECFSGGEAFRVHFALRIALSQLLARRAGARLQTLIIDEGFGSQDSEGRDRLVEAIHTVQDEFDKILVITHIDELKDAFPTRIEITKNHLGSQIHVV
jgi:exonuclease SbcC